ncbi:MULTISPECIES: hypothetical protein [Thermocrispum]|uniref:Uncharacterized protein n=1 Tax=Thermocrispum agreste TaxID=37925 RepID=A0A2W4JM11_9PSEU|nr:MULTISPECIES: hypothetical protein [Thermocrispum]PZN00171.1 MAG: hypothetical protein DIU77_04195 [Thermocrispum agreste]
MNSPRIRVLTMQIAMARRELQRARCDRNPEAAARAERRMNALLDQYIALRSTTPARQAA